MEIKEFIEKFAEIFDDTDASTLTPETSFASLMSGHLFQP